MRMRASSTSQRSARKLVLTLEAQVAAFFAARAAPKIWITGDSGLYQGTDTTTPVTTAGQFIGRINDRSGANNHFQQATQGQKPVYAVSNGFKYISADGSDDAIGTITDFDMSSVNKATIIISGKRRNIATTNNIFEFTGNAEAAGGLSLMSENNDYVLKATGSAAISRTGYYRNDPDNIALMGQVDLSNGSGFGTKITISGDSTSDNTTVGSRMLGNGGMNLFSRSNYALFSPFDLACFMVIGGACPTSAELSLLVTYAASKTGL